MKLVRLLAALALVLPALPICGQNPGVLEFEPKVGVTGTRVTLTSPIPAGAVVRFGSRAVTLLEIPGHHPSFVVPEGSDSSFVEVSSRGKVVLRSAVPFVVAGSSIIQTPKLMGLKEAIDVFGYSEPVPEGGGKPEPKVKPVLSLGDDDVLTIGEPPPQRMLPAVQLGDVASAATQGMGPPAFVFTARTPKKKLVTNTPEPFPLPKPTPTPTPTPTPAPSSPPPDASR